MPVSSVDAAGNYRLIAQDGKLFSRSSLKGRPYITYFGYSSCRDGCTATLRRLADVRTRMGLSPQQLPIVFITVDPEHDDPGRLASFVKDLGQPIIALTGSVDVIHRVTDNAAVFVETKTQPDGSYRIEHTTNAYVYDADGDFWDTIALREGKATIAAKLRTLLKSAAVAQPAGSASTSIAAPQSDRQGHAS